MAPQNPIKEMMDRAEALDRRRQEQIAEQVKVINRLKARGDQAEEYIAAMGMAEAYEDWRRDQGYAEPDDDGGAAVPAAI